MDSIVNFCYTEQASDKTIGCVGSVIFDPKSKLWTAEIRQARNGEMQRTSFSDVSRELAVAQVLREWLGC